MASLETLRSNNLTSLPDDFGELRCLKVLRIKYNQLARLPAPLARLPALATLELSGNQIARLELAPHRPPRG